VSAPDLKRALTLAKFTRWLKGLPPETSLGTFLDTYDCAIARYLKASGVDFASVGGDSVVASTIRIRFPPKLSDAQERAMDANPKWVNEGAEITAAQYLKAIRA
jgi:hypothetical protein